MPTLSTTLTNPTIPAAPEQSLSKLVPGPVDYYFVFDNGSATFTDQTTEANEDTANDVDLLPAAPVQSNDRHFVGSDTLFVGILYKVGTAGGGTYTGLFEYSNGVGFSTLTSYFGAIADLDNFKVAERVGLFLLPPSDFAPVTINGQLAYWIRYEVQAAGAGYTQPLADRIWLYPPVVGGQIMRAQIF